MNRKLVLMVSVLVLAMSLSACSAAPTATMTAQPPAATQAPVMSGTTATINIANYAFDPPTLTIKEGTTVSWTNTDSAIHTVTSDTGVFDSGDMAKGATFSYTFTTAGTYVYHCLPHHAKMEGTIIVTK
jgi:plastocyanin